MKQNLLFSPASLFLLAALTGCSIVPLAVNAQEAVQKPVSLEAQQAEWKPLRHNVPPGIAQWKRLAARAANELQSVTVALKLPDPAALEAFAQRVQDPASPDYHQFLTVPEYTRRFAPSVEAVNAVKNHLTAFGLKITEVLPNRLSVKAQGTTAQIQNAFATTIALYQVGTARYFGNTTPPKLPGTVAVLVDDIYGLDDAPRLKPMYQPPPPTPPFNAVHLRTAYNLDPFYAKGFRGAGKTIAIFSSFSTTPSDTTRYITDWIRTMPSTPAGYTANIAYINVDGGPANVPATASNPNGGNLEADLDLQQVLSVAPDAAIRFYGGPNTGQGQFDTRARIVADNSADIVTESYGGAESKYYTVSQHTQFVTAVSQGMTYFASSGDFGSTQDTNPNTNPNAVPPILPIYTLSVAFPASDPNVTAVGGTTVSLDTNFNITGEVGWNGSGGGYSTRFLAATWQANTGNGQNQFLGIANPNNVRLLPDISSHATGCVTYSNGMNRGVGGTSASSPFWAAATALMENYMDSIYGGAYRQANISNRMYLLSSVGAFRDITSGNNRQSGTGTNYDCKAGYDLVTGLGSTDFYALADRLTESFLFVDKNNAGIQNGTPRNPYRSVITAVNAASSTNRTGIYIRDANYNEIFTGGNRVTKRIHFYNWYQVNKVKVGTP